MPLSESFGESLEAVLPTQTGWLRSVARSMVSDASPVPLEDLIQEGLIAMWEAHPKFDPKQGVPMAAWLQRSAKWRMQSVVMQRSPLTGQERERKTNVSPRGVEARAKIRAFLSENPKATNAEISRGTGISQATVSVQRKQLWTEAETRDVRTYSLEATLEVSGQYDTPASLVALSDALDVVLEAYHRGEVAEALEALTEPQRRYVKRRFWEGATTSELTKEWGYDPRGVWAGAKKTLSERLRPLIEA